MKIRAWMGIAVFAVATVLIGTDVLSQEDKDQVDPMMAKMMEAAAPGEFHKHLQPLIGKWNTTTKYWFTQEAPPEESTGSVDRKWILGGRFVSEDYRGTAMGQPFSGFGLMGYDNIQKKYDTVWIDTMGTGVFTQSGSCDDSGKNFTFSGKNLNPMTGQKEWGKTTLKIINNDKHVLKMFEKGTDGKDFLKLEIVATRK